MMQQRYNSGGGGRGPGGADRRAGAAAAGGSSGGERSAAIEEALKPPREREAYFQANSTAARPALLDAEAQRIAKALATVPPSQLRRFYAEVMALRRRLDLDASLPDDEISAHLALLKAKAAYTCKRAERYPIDMVKFFTLHAASADGREKFMRGFQPHFEAVMAYHRVFAQKTGDRD
jgi:CRISPR type III-A-associated protein Csm2